MNSNEKAYYDKLMEKVNEIRELKIELEKHQNLDERIKDFEWKYFKYKKYFNPLAREYNKVYSYSLILNEYLQKLYNLYEQNLLLNPNFNVKLSDDDKNKIIKELQTILLEFGKLKMPKEYDIIRETDLNPKSIKTTKKEFELKHFVIKKNK